MLEADRVQEWAVLNMPTVQLVCRVMFNEEKSAM